MILLDVVQGSEAWEQARIGIPTASCFDKILTPKTLKPAESKKYRNELLAEWLLGFPLESFQSGWMDRGTALEPKAREHYEMKYDVEVVPIGLVLRDDYNVAGSPDGFIGEDGGLEIKVPAPHTHVGYLLDNTLLAGDYRHQAQGNMYLSGRSWWDVYSYCPDLPSVRVRLERNDAYIEALESALEVFIKDLNEAKERLAPHKVAPFAQQLAEAVA